MQRADLLDVRAWLSPRNKRFWALLLIAAYTLAGFFLAPWLLRTNIGELVRQYAQRDAEVGSVRFNPWTLRLQLNGFVLRDTDKSVLVGFDELVVNLQIRSVVQRALVFHEVTLTRPAFSLVRYAYADTNLQRLLADIDAAAATDDTPAATDAVSQDPLRLVIDNLNIAAGVVDLRDELPATPFTTRLEPIDISVRDLSTLPDQTGLQQISVRTENGSSLKWSGNLQLTPLKSAGTLAVSGSPLPLIYRYLKEQLNFSVQDCCLDLSVKYALAGQPDGNVIVQVQNLDISSRELEVRALEGDEPILRIPEIRLKGGALEWPAQKVRIAEITVAQPVANIWIREDGVLNLATLLPEQPAANPPAPEQAAASSSSEDAAATTESIAAAQRPAIAATEPSETIAADGPTEPVWDLELAQLRIEGMQVSFTDRSLPRQGQLSIPKLDLTISNISNRPAARSPFTVTAQLGDKGRLDLQGDAGLLPAIDIQTRLELTDFSLPDLQPWVEPVARIAIRDGLIGFSGTLASSDTEQLAVDGNFDVRNLAVSDTLENVPLLGWKKLSVQKARLKMTKNRLNISQATFDEPFLRLIIAADGSTNFAALAKDGAADDTATATAAADGAARPVAAADSTAPAAAANPAQAAPHSGPLVVRLGQTLINNGAIEFADLSLPLPFEVPIKELDGSVSALATDSQGSSDIDMEGKVGDYGYVSVAGEINAAAPTEQADIKVTFRNINVPDLSPYTVEFAGRKVAAGQLDLDLNYQFDQRIMRGDNKILLDKFQLGERVENPDALDLPLDLAVSLLTDSNGIIDLQLEVTGDMNDPSFSAIGVFLKVLTNLITKAATAPFKLLAGLLPGSPDVELDALDFRPGRARLLPPEREKLQQLATALAQRPQLVLTVPGRYNTELDTRALQAKAVADQVAGLVGDEEDEEQELLTRRTRKALETLARAQLPDLDLGDLRDQFERPQPDTGRTALDQIAYMAELRTQLEAVQQIDSAQLETLAARRQTAIITALQKAGQLDAGRIANGTLGETTAVKNDFVRIELEIGTGASTAATGGAG